MMIHKQQTTLIRTPRIPKEYALSLSRHKCHVYICIYYIYISLVHISHSFFVWDVYIFVWYIWIYSYNVYAFGQHDDIARCYICI